MNTKKIMHFLKGIAANNNKQWFQEHKAEYDTVKADFENGVDQIISCLATFDDEVSHLTAKDCTYRFIVTYVSHLIRVRINATWVHTSVHVVERRCEAVIIYIFSQGTAWLLLVAIGCLRIY